jgi:hypothetical protein
MQTSIEWLIEQLTDYKYLTKDAEHYFEQAKEMHKQEIIKSNRDGVDMVIGENRFVTGEQYYQETFKKD